MLCTFWLFAPSTEKKRTVLSNPPASNRAPSGWNSRAWTDARAGADAFASLHRITSSSPPKMGENIVPSSLPGACRELVLANSEAPADVSELSASRVAQAACPLVANTRSRSRASRSASVTLVSPTLWRSFRSLLTDERSTEAPLSSSSSSQASGCSSVSPVSPESSFGRFFPLVAAAPVPSASSKSCSMTSSARTRPGSPNSSDARSASSVDIGLLVFGGCPSSF
mmetsp:Transcript_58585/g.79893  ORF Transcript_58585/g.79893 Transcript_58585/m.79893 type:complete len:226 (-) Transcript_58585:64-741(-)